MGNPICPTCTNPLAPEPHGTWFCPTCMFDALAPTVKDPYINHCWNCGFKIDSRTSVKSLIPDMGYHCGKCGKDLTEWKYNLRGLAVGYWERIIPGPVAVSD